MENKIKCFLMTFLILITFTNISYSKTSEMNTFICKQGFIKENKTKEEVYALKVNYIKELDSKINKDVKTIQSHLNKKSNEKQIDELLLNYMKKVLCIDDLIGDLDYFEDLYNIKNKFENDLDSKRKYQESFIKLTDKEKERILRAFNSIDELKKNGDF